MTESHNGFPQAPVIDVQGVSKWFGSVVAVNDVSLQVYPGITGLLGPNGAGKSTILHMITGKAACSEGDVAVLGQPVPPGRTHHSPGQPGGHRGGRWSGSGR